MEANEAYEKRDILLARIDERQKQMLDKQEHHLKVVEAHISKDDNEFKTIRKRIFYLTMAIVVLSMTIGGPSLLAKVIP